MGLDGRIVLITGGGRGIGRDAALRIAAAGGDVLLTWVRDEKAAEETVGEIERIGRRAVALPLDAGDVAGHAAFAEDVTTALAEGWNREDFDALVNNAGVVTIQPIAETSEAIFDEMLNVHFRGVWFLTQKLLPRLADGGRIVNVSSGLARFSFPGYAAYGCMKSATETFTRYLAKEVGDRGVTANVVAPGPVETDLNRERFEESPETVEMLSRMTSLGRVGRPRDIGGVIAFLCSDEAGWITGQRIELSGGMLI